MALISSYCFGCGDPILMGQYTPGGPMGTLPDYRFDDRYVDRLPEFTGVFHERCLKAYMVARYLYDPEQSAEDDPGYMQPKDRKRARGFAFGRRKRYAKLLRRADVDEDLYPLTTGNFEEPDD